MRGLFIQAILAIARHDLFLTRHDFSALLSSVHALPVQTRGVKDGDIEAVCTAVALACIWYPKRVVCLQRSSAAVELLRRYGIPAELVIGAQRLPLRSHAWVEVRGQVVNDKPEIQGEYFILERC
jgi:hypothetical protein